MMRLHTPLAALLMLLLVSACGSPGVSRLQPVVVRAVAPEISMKYNFYENNDSLHFLIKFEDEQGVMDVLQSATAMEYFVRPGLDERTQVLAGDSLIKPHRKLSDVEGQLQMSFSIPAQFVREPNVLHLRLWHALVGQERMAVRFTIPLEPGMLEKQYLLVKANTGHPLFNEYVNTSEKLVVQQHSDSTKQLEVQYFKTEFSPALPPMSERQEAQPRTLTADSTFYFAAGDTALFQKEGLYLFNPASDFSRGVLVQKWAFPQVTMAQELLQPLIYVTTSSEREKLFNARNAKEAVDDFWLKVGGSKAAARDLIRTYYGRVETANKLFTSHKPGWTTDRGMIYIIYGRPSNVSNVGKTITWIYRESETSPYVKFVFNKKENNFTENHYELVRLREYEDSWYSTVAKWRAGITEI
ncbi:GWxTD domain-containing protein [Pontibacter sp. MBLB2868]|uniref:GWxTD domain-containing protein n=1 Tax=Pontibacter sp. MBLB2868 TaxID=3451555 RepID=UPI003F74B86E